MKVSTLPRFLLGSRSAILEVAASRVAIPVGVLLVVSAGLAREYDGEDLVHEPWHILRPLAASLVSGSLLFAIVAFAALAIRARKGTGTPPTPLRAYLSFMGLFWMTAPLAWLYAIPYERMLSPVEAVEVNLWTLALVALWRVVLMSRVVGVVYGIGIVPAFFFVMLFADIVTFAAVSLAPTPIIDVMGGIRHSARDQLVADTTFLLQIYSVLSFPVWAIGALIALCRIQPDFPTLPEPGSLPRSRSLYVFALASILAFAPLLIIAQPEQIRRHTAEGMLLSGRVAEGLAYMSRFESDDFPPQWEPPPRLGYGEDRPPTRSIADAMAADLPTSWPAPWVAEIYVPAIRRYLHMQLDPHGPFSLSRTVEALNESGLIADVSVDALAIARFVHEFDPALPDEDRAAIESLLRLHDTDRMGEWTPDEAAARLNAAIYKDESDMVQTILSAGIDPNHRPPGSFAKTPLVQAVGWSNFRAAQLLIAAGADVNLPSGSDGPPAHAAILERETEILTLLLDRGADPNAPSPRNKTLLHAAIFYSNIEATRILLERDDVRARVNIADDSGWTPLHRAYQRGNAEIIRLLLDAGADPNARDTNGRLPSDMKR